MKLSKNIDGNPLLKRRRRRQSGAALLLVVFFLVIISVAVVQSATVGAMSELRLYRGLSTSKFAYVAAEAGIEDMYYRMIAGKQTPASLVIALNNATSTITKIDVSADEKDFYASGDASGQIRKLFIKTERGSDAQFSYAAQIGEGGITMSNNVTVDGTGLSDGNIHSNGQISGTNNVLIYGNVISSSGITADQSALSTACEADEIVGKTNPKIDYAQSFVVATTSPIPLPRVALYLKRVGNPASANVRIVADNAGSPATSALASRSLSYSLVDTNYGWVNVTFSSPATVLPGGTYWVVFDSGQNASKYWYWCRSSASTYGSGSPKYKQVWNTAGAWTDVSGDMAFQIYYGAGESKVAGSNNVSVSGLVKADTLTNLTITGDAYYQSISGSTVSGSSYSGSPTPPHLGMPISSTTIASWKTEAEVGGVISGNCGTSGVAGCNTFPLTLGPKKINGNLNVINNETLTISGTLWVTGAVRVENNSTVRCAFEYLANSCMLIADGAITVLNNGILQGSGTSGSYLFLLTTKQGCNGPGSGGTGCAANTSGISIGNNTINAILYATDSMVDVYNNAILTAIVAYKLNLTNNAQIIYDPVVSSIGLSPSATSSGSTWNANRWNEF